MDVFPLFLTDQLLPLPNIRTRTVFIVEECLDADLLKSSLDDLIRNHWRILGARIVTKKNSDLLEYHLPKQFEPGYELFRWSSKQYDHSIDVTAGGIRNPPQDKGPQILPSMAEVDSWFKPADWPLHRTDDPADSPIIYAHLSLFTDATVICTSVPHASCDQMGLSRIVNAWLGLAEGIQPKPLIPSDQDVLPGKSRSFKDYSKAEITRKGRQRVMGKGEYALVVMPFIPDLVLNSKEQHCILFFPHELVKSLRKRHSEALREKHGNLPRISDGDILAAVLLKFCRLTKSSTRTISLSQSVSLHGRAPNLDNYIHNSLFDSTARLPVGPSTPIGDIAFANRQALEAAVRPEDFEISMATYREMCRRRQSSHTCEPGDRSFYVSNWSAAWRGIDFSSVVKGQKKTEGIPKFVVLGQSRQLSDPMRFSSLILSRTDNGYYVEFAGTPATMKSLKKYLAKDPLLESL